MRTQTKRPLRIIPSTTANGVMVALPVQLEYLRGQPVETVLLTVDQTLTLCQNLIRAAQVAAKRATETPT